MDDTKIEYNNRRKGEKKVRRKNCSFEIILIEFFTNLITNLLSLPTNLHNLTDIGIIPVPGKVHTEALLKKITTTI